jgi:lipopolysaccharide/colanic/teichoic acid biosynthesis glycosyltransferase
MKPLVGERRLSLHRPFDIVTAAALTVASAPVVAVVGIALAISTRHWPIFRQVRIGRSGQPFVIYKLRTMRTSPNHSTITSADDPRITPLGAIVRRSKLDELPQLLNVLLGDMSFIGPRPDVPGYADALHGENTQILSSRPGITGLASLLLADEEELLARTSEPDSFNDSILYPLKCSINLGWLRNGSLGDDLRILAWTLRRPSAQQIESLASALTPGLRESPEFQAVRKLR